MMVDGETLFGFKEFTLCEGFESVVRSRKVHIRESVLGCDKLEGVCDNRLSNRSSFEG
jgi:hypothetical protein